MNQQSHLSSILPKFDSPPTMRDPGHRQVENELRTITSPPSIVERPRPASRGNTALTNASDSPRVNADEPKSVRPSRIRSPSPKQGSVPSRGPMKIEILHQANSGQSSSVRARNASP